MVTSRWIAGLALIAFPVTFYVANLASALPAQFPTASRYGAMGIAALSAQCGSGLNFNGNVAYDLSSVSPTAFSPGCDAAGFIFPLRRKT